MPRKVEEGCVLTDQKIGLPTPRAMNARGMGTRFVCWRAYCLGFSSLGGAEGACSCEGAAWGAGAG